MANSIEWKLLQYYMNGFTSLGLERKISFIIFIGREYIVYSHKVNTTGSVLVHLIYIQISKRSIIVKYTSIKCNHI